MIARHPVLTPEETAQRLIWAQVPPHMIHSDMALAHVLFEIICEVEGMLCCQVPQDFPAIRASYAEKCADHDLSQTRH